MNLKRQALVVDAQKYFLRERLRRFFIFSGSGRTVKGFYSCSFIGRSLSSAFNLFHNRVKELPAGWLENHLMFCHEGPWDKVDRIWTINVKTRKVTLMHKRTMDMEIVGHEFFSPDGKKIYYDLQMPKG